MNVMTTYGLKYDKALSTTEIAKRLRQDVKAARENGELPRELRLSVKTKYFSQGSSIDVSIVAWPDNLLIFDPERIILEHDNPATFHDETNNPIYTAEGLALIRKLEGMLRVFNFDGSQPQSDYFHVNFYGSVTVDWEAAKLLREKILQEHASKGGVGK